ncbi:collagenase-like protease [Gottschalkia purinilytica]|uniref:Collagenase-like protease n=1 Tax=Gottschalkia purinilytica TaxID=1503 RepID=A0A0L0WEI1_GOTPU|nr:U32 family peptidase [Gottschalkia purinilytica]KNF09874.1 collagenase-like protease [Gottschalkia purinilytica]
MKKPELLAPAGDLEKLKIAITYGADAVYLGGEAFGLRASAKNFTIEEMEEGIKFAHERNKKVYVTLNIIPHNDDLIGLSEYVKTLENIGVDAVLVADPGIFSIVKDNTKDMEIHLSTQANTTNYQTAKFWYDQGVKRVVVARELSLEEIKDIIDKTPEELEIEAFVHGAMCISYSGRCLLSNYMTHRDANRGECAQSCRWKYYLVEEKRPGEYYPIVEDEKGTYIYNSKDLCMLKHIPELIESGIHSFKIEGRMKTPYYVATVVRAYRMLIDEYLKDPENYKPSEKWLEEIKKASYRDFTTGFYFGKPDDKEQLYTTSSYIRTYDFAGLVLDYDESTGIATIEQRNRIFVGNEIEVFGPNKEHFVQKVEKMWNEKGEEIEVAPHPKQIIKMKMDNPVEKWDMLRMAIENN